MPGPEGGSFAIGLHCSNFPLAQKGVIPLPPLAAGFHLFSCVFPHRHFFPGTSFWSLDQRADLITKHGEAGAAERGARDVSFGVLPRGIPTSQPCHGPCKPAQVACGFWRCWRCLIRKQPGELSGCPRQEGKASRGGYLLYLSVSSFT